MLSKGDTFTMLLENAADGILIIDSRGIITAANPQVETLLGYAPGELRKQPLETLLPEGQRHRHARLREGFMQAPRACAMGSALNISGQHRDGHAVPLEISLTPAEIDGQTGIIAIIRDASQRRLMETTLRDIAMGLSAQTGKDFFQGMLGNIAGNLHMSFAFIGMLAEDHADRIQTLAVLAHGQMQENFTYPLQDTPCDNVVGKQLCAYSQDVQKTFSNDRMLVDMGVESYVGIPLSSAAGKPLGLLAVMHDRPLGNMDLVVNLLHIYAARAAAELERMHAEMEMCKLSSAVQQTADTVLITDRDGIIEYVNPAFCSLTGYTSAEVCGRTPRMLKSGRQDSGFYTRLWDTILSGKSFNDVLINCKKNGSLYYEQKTITPIRDKDGEITHFVSTGKDITQQMQMQERMQYLAQHDPITGLPNRSLLRDRLASAIAYANDGGHQVCLIFFDLDNFKDINDSFGHTAGDGLLMSVAHRLQQCAREQDTLARFGDDEFAFIVNGITDIHEAMQAAENLLAALQAPFAVGDGSSIPVSASLGIALYPADASDADGLIMHADTAMYRAKDLGRGNYQFFMPEMNRNASERLRLGAELHRAIENQEFEVFYQPQIDLRSGRMVGAEALLRWRHPDRGLVLPGEFIGLLEDSQQIVEVGKWLLSTVCAQNRQWQQAGLPAIPIAVNLSVRQFQDGKLHETVLMALEASGLDSAYLELEITESVLMEGSSSHHATLSKLKSAELHIALDDFGTGYSSLSYLKRYPVDSIKIDRAFVKDITHDADDAAIARAIISMARSLRLSVTAEGVETEGQLRFLQTLGCDRMQGFLVSPPLAAPDFAALLGREIRHINTEDNEARDRRTLLIVDADGKVVSSLKRALRREGYRILSASNAREAYELLALHPVGVVIADQCIPGISGMEFLSHVRQLHPDTLRIVLTDHSELNAIADSSNQGAIYKFFTRPWDDALLLENIREAFQHYEMSRENHQLRDRLSRLS